MLNALRSKYLGLSPEAPAAKCAEIYTKDPQQAPVASGYYFVGGSERSYCEFNFNTPGGFDSYGWQRLALTDMTDPQTSCPSGLNLRESGGVRYCIKTPDPDAGSCHSLYYQPTSSVKRMYGRVYGIQIGEPDIQENPGDIDTAYVDGVSLTYDRDGSRGHIWTFYSTSTETNNDCPCSSNPARTTPDYVRDNYFCEAGTSETDFTGGVQAYVSDPLWDGANCLMDQAPCCNTGPWFYREFNVPFGDRVELRICTDEGTNNEDIGVQLIELYFQ